MGVSCNSYKVTSRFPLLGGKELIKKWKRGKQVRSWEAKEWDTLRVIRSSWEMKEFVLPTASEITSRNLEMSSFALSSGQGPFIIFKWSPVISLAKKAKSQRKKMHERRRQSWTPHGCPLRWKRKILPVITPSWKQKATCPKLFLKGRNIYLSLSIDICPYTNEVHLDPLYWNFVDSLQPYWQKFISYPSSIFFQPRQTLSPFSETFTFDI